MRFAVLVKANEVTEAGVLPSAELLHNMGRFNDELIKAGIMLAGDGLQPSSKGARLTFKGGQAGVIDGPFAETKELVAGFWIVQGKSKEEVIERFKHAPMLDGDVLEIRPLYEAEDFEPSMADEMRKQDERMRASWS